MQKCEITRTVLTLAENTVMMQDPITSQGLVKSQSGCFSVVVLLPTKSDELQTKVNLFTCNICFIADLSNSFKYHHGRLSQIYYVYYTLRHNGSPHILTCCRAFLKTSFRKLQGEEGGLLRNLKYLSVNFVGSLIIKMLPIHIWQPRKHQRIKITII